MRGKWFPVVQAENLKKAITYAENFIDEYEAFVIADANGKIIKKIRGLFLEYQEEKKKKAPARYKKRKKKVPARYKKSKKKTPVPQKKRKEKAKPKKLRKIRLPAPKLTYFFRMGSFYLNVMRFDLDYVFKLVDLLRKLGVTRFRFVRRVPASRKYPAGHSSTNWRGDIHNMSTGELMGYLGSMFIPGVDEIEQIIIPEDQLPDGALD